MKRNRRLFALLAALSILVCLLSGCAVDRVSLALDTAAELTDILAGYGGTSLPGNTGAPAQTTNADPQAPEERGSYTGRDELALYIHTYGHLPDNFVTKSEARQTGWNGGSLEGYLPGKCIGGDRFGNREGLLPDADGRVWTECDVNTLGADSRGAERIVFSNDGLVYYTDDHYDSFQLLYD